MTNIQLAVMKSDPSLSEPEIIFKFVWTSQIWSENFKFDLSFFSISLTPPIGKFLRSDTSLKALLKYLS